MMISSDYSYPYPSPTRIPSSEDDAFKVSESPLRAASSTKTASAPAATDTVEISGSETVYPYTAMYDPPVATPAAEAETPAARLGLASASAAEEDDEGIAAEGEGEDAEAVAAGEEETASGQELTEDEQRQVQELKQRDQEVRTHEQAHKSVGGQYAGAMSFEYQQGLDGQRYAVGGEVSIDISKERDPAATAAKMRQVRAAALAPANPSSQDQSVAAQASQLEAEARQEISEQRVAEANGEGEGGDEAETDSAESGRSAAGGTGETGETDDASETAAAGMGQAAEPSAARSGPMSAGEGVQSADAVRDGARNAGAASGASESGPAANAVGSASIAAATTASLSSPYVNNSPASLFSAAQYGPAGGMRSRIDIVA